MMTPRYFADLPSEILQAVAQTTVVCTLAILLTTMLPEARAHFPYALLMLPLPLLWGTPLMRGLSLLLLCVCLYLAFHYSLFGLLAIGSVAFLSSRLISRRRDHFTRLSHSRYFRGLGYRLPGWQARAPRWKGADSHCRVVTSPTGRSYVVALSLAHETQQNNQPKLLWQGVTSTSVRTIVQAEAADIRANPTLLWIVPPKGARGRYKPQMERGVTTLFGEVEQIARQLQDWDSMKTNVQAAQEKTAQPGPQQQPGQQTGPNHSGGPQRTQNAQSEDSVYAAEGRRVEAQAREALKQILPAGWLMQTSVILLSGGDADIVLTAPGGEKFAVDVKSRRDQMNLAAPRAGRVHTWQELHDQVLHAATQLKAVGVVWQPTANSAAPIRIGSIYNVRGHASELVAFLQSQVSAPKPKADYGSRSDFELLGITPGADKEAIKAAYRQQIKKYHPDKMASFDEEFRVLAEEKSKALNAAYQRLLAKAG